MFFFFTSTVEELELRLRKKAIALVTNFIGASGWRERFPVQRSGIISFDFISEAQEVDEDFSEFDDLNEAIPDQNSEDSDPYAESRSPAVPRQKATRGMKGSQQLTQQRPARAGRART